MNTKSTHSERKPCYELEYALDRLREAIDFAEIEGDFQPLRKWCYEVRIAIIERLNASQPANAADGYHVCCKNLVPDSEFCCKDCYEKGRRR